MQAAMLWPASGMGIRRETKRETVLVSYNDLDTWHSGDRRILLASFQSYDMSVTFISDM